MSWFRAAASNVRYRVGLLGMAGAFALLGLSGCERENKFQPPPPPEVTVAQPVQQEVVNWMDFTGTTRAAAKVELRARVNGYLKAIHFKDGDDVKQGQLLFEIEPAEYEVARNSAAAELQKMQTALQLAESEWNRIEDAYRRGAITPSERDVKAAELASARANVAAAQAALDRAELDLSYTKIYAPMSGRIGQHLVDVGNLVQREQTVLAVIESVDPIHVYFSVSESQLLQFMEMMRNNQLPDPNRKPPVLYVGLGYQNNYPYQATLDFREFGVDPSTGTTMRRARIPNPDGQLVPGLFVRVRAPIGEPTPKLLVSEVALGADQRGDFVLVVNAENKVEYRPVRLGARVGSLRVIEEGVQPGEWVVVNGLQRALPGAEVNPQQTTMVAQSDEMAGTVAAGRAPSPSQTLSQQQGPRAR